jgi:hypothetical protein
LIHSKNVTGATPSPTVPAAPSLHPDRLRRIPDAIPSTIDPSGTQSFSYPRATREEIAHVEAFFQRFGIRS